jgi:hypothetical protein
MVKLSPLRFVPVLCCMMWCVDITSSDVLLSPAAAVVGEGCRSHDNQCEKSLLVYQKTFKLRRLFCLHA